MSKRVINVVVAGLGGQGVIKASDILADVAFRAGLDVKKAEVHGMSQRGGSVSTDVRFGEKVLSPMVPAGEADYLVVLSADQVENNRGCLREAGAGSNGKAKCDGAGGGVLIAPGAVDESNLANKRAMNIALLGVLSRHLEFPESLWAESLRANLPERMLEMNLKAFAVGRSAAGAGS